MAKLYIKESEVNSQLAWLYVLLTKSPVQVIKCNSSNPQTDTDSNPIKMFPFLVADDTRIWGEHAVLIYIAEKYANNALYGGTVEEKAKINSILYWLGGSFHRSTMCNYVHPQSSSTSQQALSCKIDVESDNKLLIDYGLQTTSEQLTNIEKVYFGAAEKRFLYSKQSVADFYLALILIQLEHVNLKLDTWPKISSWFKEYKTQITALLV